MRQSTDCNNNPKRHFQGEGVIRFPSDVQNTVYKSEKLGETGPWERPISHQKQRICERLKRAQEMRLQIE